MASTSTPERTDARIVEAGAAGKDIAVLLDYVRQRPSLKERFAAGKALRGRVPRAEFAHYKAAANRPALALAHAKSGDAAMIAGYCGKSGELDDAIARFALAYEKQTNQDHEALDKARKSGRIRVASSEVVK